MAEALMTRSDGWLEVSNPPNYHRKKLPRRLSGCYGSNVQAITSQNSLPASLASVSPPVDSVPRSRSFPRFLPHALKLAITRESERGVLAENIGTLMEQSNWFRVKWRHVIMKWYREVRIRQILPPQLARREPLPNLCHSPNPLQHSTHSTTGSAP